MEGKLSEEKGDKASDSGKKIDSYWEQIRKLDERVKEIAGDNYVSSRSETRSPSSLSSRVSRGTSCEPSSSARNESSSCQPDKLGMMNGGDQTNILDCVAAAVDNSRSTSIHDVFEVPQAEVILGKDDIGVTCGSSKNLVIHTHTEAMIMCARDEPEWLKRVLQSNIAERKLGKPSDIDCCSVVVQPTSSISQFNRTLNQVNRTSEIVETDRPAESGSREEELRLLNEIKQKLERMHDVIRNLEASKSSITREELSLSMNMTILSEAMLQFWL